MSKWLEVFIVLLSVAGQVITLVERSRKVHAGRPSPCELPWHAMIQRIVFPVARRLWRLLTSYWASRQKALDDSQVYPIGGEEE